MFYFIKNEGFLNYGYESGALGENEKPPEGATVVESEKELNALIEKAEKDDAARIDADVGAAEVDIEALAKQYKTGQLKKLLTDNKVDGRSKLKTEVEMVTALLDAGVTL